jgi:NAD(P)-dependent dehydrogenase (short-subunit alcohol dehydrogenase family)
MVLSGRTVFVTGAARGIGEHVARAVAARGGRVFLAGLEPDRLAALASELDGAWSECDVTDQAALTAAAEQAVAVTGRIDAVVANAGVVSLGTVGGGDVEALVRTIEVNLVGAVRTVRATLPAVAAARGYYLLISSVAAFTAMPGMAGYCAAKAGVENFGNALRLELASTGVGVGTAYPSWVDTDLVRDVRRVPTVAAALGRLPWPLRRAVPVDACARALVEAIEHRRRRVYVPHAVAPIQALRTLVNSRPVEALLSRVARDPVARLDAEVAAVREDSGPSNPGTPPAGS